MTRRVVHRCNDLFVVEELTDGEWLDLGELFTSAEAAQRWIERRRAKAVSAESPEPRRRAIRDEHLGQAAMLIARSVPELAHLLWLLERDGRHKRLVAAIKERLPREALVGGEPRPDPRLWIKGRL
jgi:hypothetical protein